MELASKLYKDRLGNTLVDCNFFRKRDKLSISKTLSLEDYINVLSSSVKLKNEQPLLSIGKIPNTFFDGAISGDGRVAGIFVYPAQKRYFKEAGGEGKYIAFPTLVFAFCTNTDGRLSRSFCFSSKTDELTPDTKLYLYPYGNVSHHGSICWGDGACHLHNIRSIAELERCVEVFFSSTTAPHYYQANINTTLNLSHHDLVNAMEKVDIFPADNLRFADVTVQELLNKILN